MPNNATTVPAGIPNLDTRLTFEPDAHTYHFDGEEVPSVSTILGATVPKPALVNWARNMAVKQMEATLLPLVGTKLEVTAAFIKDLAVKAKARPKAVSDEAIEIGSLTHKTIEDAITAAKVQGVSVGAALVGTPSYPTLPPQVLTALKGFLSWLNAHNVEFEATEVRVVDPEKWYAGTFDAIARIDGELTIIDWKTSTGIWDEYALQLVAYGNAAKVSRGVRATRLMAARFDKNTGEFEAKDVDNLKHRWEEFQAYRMLYGRLKDHKFKDA